MVEEKYDAIIVGGGIAGSTAALFLAKKGFKVAVVERVNRNNLGWKPCGDAIGEHYFGELGLEPPHGEELEYIVNGIDIYSPTEKHVIRVKGKGYMVNTPAFVKRIMSTAISHGATLLDETIVLAPIIENGYVVGVKARGKNGQLELRAKAVIEASGNAAVVRRKLPKDWPVAEEADPTEFNIAYREIRITEHEVRDPEYIRIYINQTIAPGGYWWLFPKGERKINVGLGVMGGAGYPSPKEMFYRYLANREDVKGEIISAAGAPVPTRRPINSLVWNGIAVIGDAGYTVNPIHGGGKGSSMLAAYCVAEAFEKAFEKNDFSAKSLWPANKCYIEKYGAKQASLDILRLFLQRMGNDEFEFIISKKLVSGDDLYTISSEARVTSRIVLRILRALVAGISRPGLLAKLKKVSDYMEEIRRYYMSYPETPEGLDEWLSGLREIYSRFNREVLG